MEDLKLIWNKLNELQLEVGKLIEMDKVETVYDKLKKEEELKKKWMPFTAPVILLTMGWIFWITYPKGEPLSEILFTPFTLGILLIIFGAFLMMYLIVKIRIPLARYQHDRSSLDFLKIVKERLHQRKKYTLIGVSLYLFILTIGVHLMIFEFNSLAGSWGMVFGLYGFMLGLTGMMIPSVLVAHNKQYKDILSRIDRFLAD